MKKVQSLLINKPSRALFTLFLLLFFGNRMWIILQTKTFYYKHKYHINKNIVEHRFFPFKNQHSKKIIQDYLGGSFDYSARIPFGEEIQLLSISYNSTEDTVFLNWNNHFITMFYSNALFESDIQLFLKTIKENTSIKTVYFLIEGKTYNLSWKNKYQLQNGINIKEAV